MAIRRLPSHGFRLGLPPKLHGHETVQLQLSATVAVTCQFGAAARGGAVSAAQTSTAAMIGVRMAQGSPVCGIVSTVTRSGGPKRIGAGGVDLRQRRTCVSLHLKRFNWMIGCSLAGALAALAMSDVARARDNEVNFSLNDTPGRWFDTGVDIAGTRSLAVATQGVRVRFSGNSNTVHTRTSLVFPAGAANMPFSTEPRKGGDSVNLTTPGLYVFTCGIHPYMFGAVIVDDPATSGLDLGNNITMVNGIT